MIKHMLITNTYISAFDKTISNGDTGRINIEYRPIHWGKRTAINQASATVFDITVREEFDWV